MSYRIDQRDLVRRGALARLAELRAEIQAIERLLGTSRGRGRRELSVASLTSIATERPARRKPVWSAAKRRAAAERMRKYWASRRAAKR